jgi:hypothetical protein
LRIEFADYLAPSTTSQVRTFAGVVTDTNCGAGHHFAGQVPEIQCVRACVKRDSKTKFALFDGTALCIFADQRTASVFAARRVLVTGILDERTRTLAIQSIDPAL